MPQSTLLRRASLRWAAAAALAPFCIAPSAHGESEEFIQSSKSISLEQATPEPTIGGTATLGAFASEDTFYGSLEALVPLSYDGQNLLFLYPQISTNDNGQQAFSVGLGYRVLLDNPNLILGANLFYDNGETAYDNHIHRLGIGAEVIGERFSARFNYYFADGDEHRIGSYTTRSTSEGSQVLGRSSRSNGIVRTPNGPAQSISTSTKTRTTTTSTSRTFERFETGMDGLDAEIGAQVPIPQQLGRVPDIWLFAGYYNFQNDYGSDVDGFRARAEFRIANWLTLDAAYYAESELIGSNWFGGVRVHIPFGGGDEDIVGWAAERGIITASAEPYGNGGGRNPLSNRMAENIIRESQTATSESGFVENPGKRTSTSSSSTSTETSNSLQPLMEKCHFDECGRIPYRPGAIGNGIKPGVMPPYLPGDMPNAG